MSSEARKTFLEWCRKHEPVLGRDFVALLSLTFSSRDCPGFYYLLLRALHTVFEKTRSIGASPREIVEWIRECCGDEFAKLIENDLRELGLV